MKTSFSKPAITSLAVIGVKGFLFSALEARSLLYHGENSTKAQLSLCNIRYTGTIIISYRLEGERKGRIDLFVS